MVKVLVCAPMDPESRLHLETLVQPSYAGWGVPEGFLAAPLSGTEIVALGREAAIIVLGPEPVSAEMLRGLPELRLLVCSRAGTDTVDVDAATRRGIPVLNAPGRNAGAVADFTIALMLELARKVSKAQAFVRSGAWTNVLAPLAEGLEGIELTGRALGLIGVGNVGRLVARRATGCGMRVLAHDPWVKTADLQGLAIEMTSLDHVLEESNFVSIHCSLTPDTRGLLDKRHLSKMKRTAYLINTARAAIVVEDALISMLQKHDLAGAALDVFWMEPVPADHPLLTLDNVVLTPHIAGAGDLVLARGSKMIVDGIEAYLQDRKLPNLVNPEVLGRHRLS